MSENNTVHKGGELDEQSFWAKMADAIGQAGREVLETALRLYYALIDDDTPDWARGVIIGALIYFVSPVDAVPDVIPVVGYSDDLAVMVAAVAVVATHIKDEHRQKAHDWVERNLA